MAEEFLADVKGSGHNIIATVYAQCHHFYDVVGQVDPGFECVGETRHQQAAADATCGGPVAT